MDIEELKASFPEGSCVLIKDELRYKGFTFKGMRGYAREYDAKSGVCVQLFFVKSYQPHWWFQPNVIANDTNSQMLPISIEVAVSSLGPRERGQSVIIESELTLWGMRCWLVTLAKAKPGQGVWDLAMEEGWIMLKSLYGDTTDKNLNRWLELNDTRVRRVQMMELEDGPMNSTPIKRPKIA